MRPHAELAAAAAPYRLALPRGALGGVMAGERLGRGVGASPEFHDYRDYRPGDDLRHVDWRAFARTDQMKVRLFREEIAPTLDLIVDTSASMVITDAKRQSAEDICAALHEWARVAEGGSGAGVRVWDGQRGTRIQRGDAIAFVIEASGSSAGHAALVPRAPLRPRGLRCVLSDFLSPDDPAPALRRIAAGGAHLYVVQLLDPWELEPRADGAHTLIDVESGARLELVLDAATIRGYRERLARLQQNLATAVRRLGGTFAMAIAGDPATMFRRDLLPAGLVEPR